MKKKTKKSTEQSVFVNLTYDSGFKAVFADKANKPLLVRLLNNLLPPEARVADITSYLDREQGKDTPDGKRTQLDLVCEGPNGERFLVEFQRSRENAFFQRCVYYAAGAYHIRLKEKEPYDILRPVYSIGLLNYNLPHTIAEPEKTENLISEYIFMEKRTKEIAPPTISIIFAELGRFAKGEQDCRTELDWLFYIFRNSSSMTDIPEEIREEPFFDELLDACRVATFPETKKMIYERNIMRERDIIAQREYAVEQARIESETETKVAAAHNLLAAGIAPEVISSCLGLPLEEVEALDGKNV